MIGLKWKPAEKYFCTSISFSTECRFIKINCQSVTYLTAVLSILCVFPVKIQSDGQNAIRRRVVIRYAKTTFVVQRRHSLFKDDIRCSKTTFVVSSRHSGCGCGEMPLQAPLSRGGEKLWQLLLEESGVRGKWGGRGRGGLLYITLTHIFTQHFEEDRLYLNT